MALQVVSPAVNVYRELGIKDGAMQIQDRTFKRGEILPSWVSPYQQFVLTSTGMARQVGDFPDANLGAPENTPQPTLLAEHRPATPLAPVQDDDAAGGSAGGDLPAETANKPVWEDFAVVNGYLSRNKAESMRKPDLVAEVTRKHGEAEAAREPVDPVMLPPTFPPAG